jgi:hypothetical protein
MNSVRDHNFFEDDEAEIDKRESQTKSKKKSSQPHDSRLKGLENIYLKNYDTDNKRA